MKKNILFFIAGMVTMFIVMLLLVEVNRHFEDEYHGLTLFEEDGACVSTSKEIKIFETIEPDMALAHTQNKVYDYYRDEILVLILGDENTHFYDDQKIDIPSGKCAKQIGTYKYETKSGVMKTVPAVEIK